MKEKIPDNLQIDNTNIGDKTDIPRVDSDVHQDLGNVDTELGAVDKTEEAFSLPQNPDLSGGSGTTTPPAGENAASLGVDGPGHPKNIEPQQDGFQQTPPEVRTIGGQQQ